MARKRRSKKQEPGQSLSLRKSPSQNFLQISRKPLKAEMHLKFRLGTSRVLVARYLSRKHLKAEMHLKFRVGGNKQGAGGKILLKEASKGGDASKVQGAGFKIPLKEASKGGDASKVQSGNKQGAGGKIPLEEASKGGGASKVQSGNKQGAGGKAKEPGEISVERARINKRTNVDKSVKSVKRRK